jgi:SAM-dependent methyltransferase
MTAKEHYDKHLSKVYTWMIGDFREKMQQEKDFFRQHAVVPGQHAVAYDLGAGTGIQSVALCQLGFRVKAVDFNRPLLTELNHNKGQLQIEIVESDILDFLNQPPVEEKAALIVCMGDTLTHLPGHEAVTLLIEKIATHLEPKGKVVFSYRDLSEERKGLERFLLLKSDKNRAMSCFLEYFPDHVMVHDFLLEKSKDSWTQNISAYPKLRLQASAVVQKLEHHQINILHSEVSKGMTYLIGQYH